MKEAEAVATRDAQGDKLFLTKDLKRENGWADGSNYKIRYQYNLVSRSNYPQMIIQILADSADELKNTPKQERDAIKIQLGLSGMLAGMTEAFGGDNPIGNALTLPKKYPEISDYLQSKNDIYRQYTDLRLIGLIGAYSILNDLGLQISAPAGTTTPREVTLTYMKTEKGWKKVI